MQTTVIILIRMTLMFTSNCSKIKLFPFDARNSLPKSLIALRMEPALNAVVSHGNFSETLMRECSPGIEEAFLHRKISFRSIPYRLHKIFEPLFLSILRAESKLRVAGYIDMC